MKRLLSLIGILILSLAGMAQAAGSSHTCDDGTFTDKEKTRYVVTCDWTADDADGSVPSATLALEGYIIKVTTNPGSTSPTNLYDITISDSDGVDLMGGTLANRSETSSEQAVPKVDTTNGIYGEDYVSGTVTIALTNNSVNSATGTIKLYMRR